MYIIIELIFAFLLGDFITGLFHWIEDAYLEPERVKQFYNKHPLFPLRNIMIEIADMNHIHHLDPLAFTKFSMIESICTTLPFTALGVWSLLAIEIFITSIPTWIYIGVIFGSGGNIMHRFIHKPETTPYIIKLLQKCYILQTAQDHNIHHKSVTIPTHDNPGHYYCVYGTIINPVFEVIEFWRKLEYLVEKVSGIKPCHH